MRKFLCDMHGQQLVDELEQRGLTPMIAADDHESEVRLRGGGFDPLFSAVASIIGNVVIQSGGAWGLLLLDGCPLCNLMRIHSETCNRDHCLLDHLPDWPRTAAEDQLQTWRERERKAGRP